MTTIYTRRVFSTQSARPVLAKSSTEQQAQILCVQNARMADLAEQKTGALAPSGRNAKSALG